jgi:hypothetical protein
MNSKAWMVAAAVLAAGSAQATCFKVYTGDGKLILESSTTPVNLSLPLGDTVPQKFGGGAFMTMSDLTVFCKDRRGEGGAQQTVAALQAKKVKLKAPNSPEAKELEAQLKALESEAKPAEATEAKPAEAVEAKPQEPAEVKPEAAADVKPEAESQPPQEQGAAPESAEKVAAE